MMAVASISPPMLSSSRRQGTSPSPKDPSTRKHQIVPLTSDRVDRTSFSSLKENNSGGAQSFTDSKNSSYLRHEYALSGAAEEAIEDLPSGIATPENGRVGFGAGRGLMLPLTNPNSLLHGFVCPCDGFRGWKQISVGGKIASRSFGDLRGLATRWEWEVKVETPRDETRKLVRVKTGGYPAGHSPLESLPMELLGSIIDQLATDIPPNGFTARNIDLMSLLLTSRGIHAATLATLYNQITIPHSRIFRKFLSHVTEHPALGTIVRRLDFSHFNPTGAGQTARERAQTMNLIPATLLQCLSLTPNLREFLAQEHIDDDLDSKVIQTLLCDLPKLKALDFCACSSTSFRDAFTSVINASPSPLPDVLPITRLSFHESPILPSAVYEKLLPRMPRLTHLDVAHTRITDEALFSIPTTARLTHLNLSKCSYLSGSRVVEFLSTHPAASALVYLNLSMDVKSHEMLTGEDITSLLPVLPSSLRSLNLKGSKMEKIHIDLLRPLTKHLEELGLGRHLELADFCRLFVPDKSSPVEEQAAWIPHSLRYIDVSDLSASQLDLGTLFGSSCPVLRSPSMPLEVIECSAEVSAMLIKSPAVKRLGWSMKEAGRRSWIVRDRKEGEGHNDGGAREWKWGANYWGMRKVPVARAEVGGMYGHYMFKR